MKLAFGIFVAALSAAVLLLCGSFVRLALWWLLPAPILGAIVWSLAIWRRLETPANLAFLLVAGCAVGSKFTGMEGGAVLVSLLLALVAWDSGNLVIQLRRHLDTEIAAGWLERRMLRLALIMITGVAISLGAPGLHLRFSTELTLALALGLFLGLAQVIRFLRK